MVLRTSGALWDYMHAYEGTLEKAFVVMGSEKGENLAVRPGVANSYAPGVAPQD